MFKVERYVPVCSASEFVSSCIVWIQLNGSRAIPDAGVGLLELEIAVAALGKHGGRVRVQDDGLGEKADGLLPARS